MTFLVLALAIGCVGVGFVIGTHMTIVEIDRRLRRLASSWLAAEDLPGGDRAAQCAEDLEDVWR
jgi:hypothetical protein